MIPGLQLEGVYSCYACSLYDILLFFFIGLLRPQAKGKGKTFGKNFHHEEEKYFGPQGKFSMSKRS